MPGRNKTGPEGTGPLTGRKMGACEGNSSTINDIKQGMGRDLRRGFAGGGRGFSKKEMGFGNRRGFRFFDNTKPIEISNQEMIEDQIKALKDQISNLEEKLKKAMNN